MLAFTTVSKSKCIDIVAAMKCYLFFFFNDTATTEIYTLSLHDALPISISGGGSPQSLTMCRMAKLTGLWKGSPQDRKSTRLNSSHGYISYAVFCLKKKKNDKERGRIIRNHTILLHIQLCSIPDTLTVCS